jgi:phosphoribosyl-ATP pyrophosphohydrolase
MIRIVLDDRFHSYSGSLLFTRVQDGEEQRNAACPKASYTASFLAQGDNRIAQRVGEESLELVLAEVAETPDKVAAEPADWNQWVTPMAPTCDLPATRRVARMR